MTAAAPQLIWDHQSHFQRATEIAARNFFKSLDPRFQPRVFLVAIPLKGAAPPMVFPTAYIPGDYLSRLHDIAATLQKGPETQARARQSALQYILDTAPSSADWATYVSQPAVIRNFNVHVVLQLQFHLKAQYYELTLPRTVMRHSLHLSLIDAAADEFLLEFADLLRATSTMDTLLLSARDKDELLRSAGKNFMQAIATASTTDPSVSLLFDAVCNIASLRYEGHEGIGRIVFAGPHHPALTTRVTFKRPIQIVDTRATRKILEICSSELCLLSDGSYIYGLGDIPHQKPVAAATGSAQQDLFIVDFLRHGEWQFLHNSHPVMKVSYGIPALAEDTAAATRLRMAVLRVFPEIDETIFETFWLAFKSASSQKHGTIIVVSENAAEEAQRLETQATLVNPVQLTPELAAQLSTIDGAILLDPACNCHAIGVILDGLATQKGDRSRGSRYNSAIRYIDSYAGRALAIAISEDGMLNVFPELRPQIAKSDIDYRIDVLETVALAENLNIAAIGQLIRWFENNRFYLLPEACDRLNASLMQLRLRLETDGDPPISFPTFSPNEEMNPSYLLP